VRVMNVPKLVGGGPVAYGFVGLLWHRTFCVTGLECVCDGHPVDPQYNPTGGPYDPAACEWANEVVMDFLYLIFDHFPKINRRFKLCQK
jgi:hypothetical protein